jgi:hypothetical protein
MQSQAEKIATLNDAFRNAMGLAGKVYQTPGIAALSPEDRSAIREKVENFNDFTLGNNPYGERDFGAFDHNGDRIFWKIDYYDTTLTYGSEDPSDPKQTVRVLTSCLLQSTDAPALRQLHWRGASFIRGGRPPDIKGEARERRVQRRCCCLPLVSPGDFISLRLGQ